MIRLLTIGLLILSLAVPVSAAEFTAPAVPDSGEALMPKSTESFAQAIAELLHKACEALRPDLAEAVKTGTGMVAIAIVTSLLQSFAGVSKSMVTLTGVLLISLQLMHSANSMIRLGCETISELSAYGKLLLPVMTAALAAQGAVTASTSLYVGTAVFDTLLSGLITGFLKPLVYLFLGIGISASALGDDTLKRIQDTVKCFITWSLKTALMVFTAYMGITGVVSGTTDAAALKATKLTISTVVPVVGGILSDASEAVLVSVGVMKNAAGIYGILAAFSIFLSPFLKIGAHYLILKAAAMVCGILDSKGIGQPVEIFAGAMGFVLAMTGAVCLMQLVSTVCFMKGIG